MAYCYPLERIYLAAEFERESRLTKRVVGTLLDGAFEGPPRNAEIERLCAMLEQRPALH